MDLRLLCNSIALGSTMIKKGLYNENCINIACDIFNIDASNLFSKSRERKLVYCRYILFDYMYNCGSFTLQYIGSIFNRDHATVVHGKKSHSDLIQINDRIYTEMAEHFKIVI